MKKILLALLAIIPIHSISFLANAKLQENAAESQKDLRNEVSQKVKAHISVLKERGNNTFASREAGNVSIR